MDARYDVMCFGCLSVALC